MAMRFAAEGMNLALADLESDALEHAATELRRNGTTVVAERVDVSNPEHVTRLADRAFAEFGVVHIVCNNAGVLPPGAPAWREDLGTWHWTLNVNFFGVLHGIQAFVPRLLNQSDDSHIVNTASLAGLTTRPLMSAYNVSKHAVVALSECLYAELQLTTEKIHVSVLCPAFARTRLSESTRNKPAGVSADPAASFGFHEALQHVIEEGTPPEEIVDQMVNAIRTQRFWVLTHPQLNSGIRDRFESMLAQTNPKLRDLRPQGGSLS